MSLQKTIHLILVRNVVTILALLISDTLRADQWSVPLAGNTFQTTPQQGGQRIRRNGVISLSGSEDAFSVYFRTDRAAHLTLSMKARSKKGGSAVNSRVDQETFHNVINTDEFAVYEIGEIAVSNAGYVRLDFQGANSGQSEVEISELTVSSETNELKLDYVRNNKGNMFYWGRRGPSVHLRYQVPRDRSIRHAYTEVTVPEGQDPIGSYFMANGFGEGYFGFQVNGPDERRVLFSVWSPFKTDNPRDIPKDQRIELLARGPEVHTGEFGNEGSGGQSFLVYPWQSETNLSVPNGG